MRLQIRELLAKATHYIFMPATVLASSLSFAGENNVVATIVTDGVVPVAMVPLPVAQGFSVQKPTSAEFRLTDSTMPDWNIPVDCFRMSSQKPTQTAAPICPPSSRVRVSNHVVLKAIGISLPPCENTSPTSACGTGVKNTEVVASHGQRKPEIQNPPVVSYITQVQWNVPSISSAGNCKHECGKAFQGECGPLVHWRPDSPDQFLPNSASDETPIGACSDLSGGECKRGDSRVTTASLATTESVHPGVLEQLQQLNPSPLFSETSGESYLSDLRQLQRGSSDWLYVDKSLLDLAPGEPVQEASSYLDDLNALAAKSGGIIRSDYFLAATLQDSVHSPLDTSTSGQAGSRDSYRSLSPDGHCESVGGASLESLFQPMSDIHLSGLSTQPPEMDKNQKSSELLRPENKVCAYLDNASPMHFHVPPRYGSSHPSRNTHQLHHNPLYYEDPNIERCGQSFGCLTTAVSVVHFGSAIAFTPFKMAQMCPGDCVQALPDCPTCHRFDHDVYCSGR